MVCYSSNRKLILEFPCPGSERGLGDAGSVLSGEQRLVAAWQVCKGGRLVMMMMMVMVMWIMMVMILPSSEIVLSMK